MLRIVYNCTKSSRENHFLMDRLHNFTINHTLKLFRHCITVKCSFSRHLMCLHVRFRAVTNKTSNTSDFTLTIQCYIITEN